MWMSGENEYIRKKLLHNSAADQYKLGNFLWADAQNK